MIFNGRKIKDISGIRSGKLVAIKPVSPHKRVGNEDRKVILWECQCDCGRKTILRTSRITSNDIKSCGCSNICGKVKKGHKLIQPLRSFKEYQGYMPLWIWSRVRMSAKRRGISFDLTPKDMDDLFIKQNKRCIFTKLELRFGRTAKDNKETTASLDRIDSKIGYISSNIQWVHKEVNLLKGIKSNIETIEYCKKIKDIVILVADSI